MSIAFVSVSEDEIHPQHNAMVSSRSRNPWVKWYDKEMRCASRGCGSSTYITVQSIPRCTTHTIFALVELLEVAYA